VLDGALALAIPTRFGQSLSVETIEDPTIYWTSIDSKRNVWFEGRFKSEGGLLTQEFTKSQESTQHHETFNTLCNILQKAKELNPTFLMENCGWKVTTTLGFSKDWGLGSSSTLINNIAQWAGIDAFELLDKSFGGSGYDIAAAQNQSPILYSKNKESFHVEVVSLAWEFTEQLFFVYLNQKQDSKEGIARYKAASDVNKEQIQNFSEITKKLTRCKTLSEFTSLLLLHEELIAAIIKIPPVKQQLFPEYSGLVKSLGAWGGDFVLVVGDETDKDYFRKKGYTTIIGFSEMIR